MTVRSFLRASAVGDIGIGFPNAGHADTFNFTSCHVSGSTCEGGAFCRPGYNSSFLRSGRPIGSK
jgi:hypothetical protein